MPRPRYKRPRHALVGGAASALLLALAGVDSGCSRPPAKETPAPRPVVAAPARSLPVEAVSRAPAPTMDDWREELAAITGEPDEARREEAWARMAETLVKSGPAEALGFCLREDASDAERDFGSRLLRRWVGDDAPAAARWAAEAPEGPARRLAAGVVATCWAETDLPAAIAWAGRLPEGEGRQAAILGVAYEAARSEPVDALALALELPEDRLRDDLLAHAVAQCAGLAPASAAAMVAEFPDELLRSRLLGAIAAAWADADPAAAARVALTIQTERERDNAVVSVVQRWAQKDPTAAAAWVAAFPEGPLRETAFENLRKLGPEKVPLPGPRREAPH